MSSQLLPLIAPLAFLVGCTTAAKPIDAASGAESGAVVLRACPMPTSLDVSKKCTTESQWLFAVQAPDAGHADTVTATITALDVGRGTVTLTGPQGQSKVVKANYAEDLRRVHVGDVVSLIDGDARSLALRSGQ